jgi:putative protease
MIPLTKQSARSNAKKLPEGFYAAVSTIGDLYVLQSVRPVRALLAYTRKVAAYLADRTKPPLPFVPSEMILVLDPFFPQGMDAALAREVPSLIERGYQSYVVNNMGHLSLFRDTGATLIAGPYLYSFNRFSAAFIAALGLSSFITPLENNRQNVEKTFDPPLRPSVFITVYALPLLFRIRSDLSGLYHFTGFSGSQGEEFSLQSGPEGSYVLPQKPFSLVDKIPFLYEAGFRRFILDFSAPPLKKKAYKDTMAAAKAGTPLSGITRFNWKDGFFSSEVSSS